MLAYNDTLTPRDLPTSVRDLSGPEWAGRVGWAPENASFQAFITAFRLIDGDDAVKGWLEAMIANGTVNFGDSNSAIVQAIGNGEIDAGLVNHYYVYAVGREAGEDFPVANHFFEAGDPGSLINVAGIGLTEDADDADAALAFADYLLSNDAQEYFATETFEYPLIEGVAPPEGLVPLSEIGHPDIELGSSRPPRVARSVVRSGSHLSYFAASTLASRRHCRCYHAAHDQALATAPSRHSHNEPGDQPRGR